MSDDDLLLTTPKSMVGWFANDKPEPKRSSEAEANSEQNAEIIAALTNKELEEPRVRQTFLCRWCLNPTTETPKSPNEYFHLRAVLMIPDHVKDPPICSYCFHKSVGGFNRHATNVGTRNDAPANLGLKNLLQCD